jgi:Txe/YoeB family toxin of Txe-Axe toxin-antitoxin module
MRRIAFHKDAWEDFTNWHSQDRKIFERIVRIINETREILSLGSENRNHSGTS